MKKNQCEKLQRIKVKAAHNSGAAMAQFFNGPDRGGGDIVRDRGSTPQT
jgi:hypothetical protein